MGNPPEVIWSYVDIEVSPEGWWVVLLGQHRKEGRAVKEPQRLFHHSALAPDQARWSAHLHAFDVASEMKLQYL